MNVKLNFLSSRFYENVYTIIIIQQQSDYYLESNFLKSSLDILVTLDSSTSPEALPGAS